MMGGFLTIRNPGCRFQKIRVGGLGVRFLESKRVPSVRSKPL